ncbi:hypothetical protein BREVUG8_10088 [Brevundimonas sp. G8]|nr:hypothetical protein BREVUG8_10088 [Brevundimonas sp. G8]
MGLSACVPQRLDQARFAVLGEGMSRAPALTFIRRAAMTLSGVPGRSACARQRETIHVKDNADRCGASRGDPGRHRGRTAN